MGQRSSKRQKCGPGPSKEISCEILVLNETNDWISPLANNPPDPENERLWDDENQRWIKFREDSGQSTPDVWNTSTQQWDLGS